MLILKRSRYKNNGSTLLEALVAIFLFSIGILALVGLQAAAIKESIDAKYRTDAAYLANQIIGQMWVDRANLASYSHYASGTNCSFSGSASTVGNVSNWVTEADKLLPGVNNSRLQIALTTPITGTRQVKVTICWEIRRESANHTSEAVVHNYAMTAHINE